MHVVACNLVLIKIPWTNTEMKRFVRFFLARSFLKARAFSPQSQFNDFLELIIVSAFAADLDDSLHIASFGSYQSSCHLEFFVVVNLNVKSACILNIVVLLLLLSRLLLVLLGMALCNWCLLTLHRGLTLWLTGLLVHWHRGRIWILVGLVARTWVGCLLINILVLELSYVWSARILTWELIGKTCCTSIVIWLLLGNIFLVRYALVRSLIGARGLNWRRSDCLSCSKIGWSDSWACHRSINPLYL